MVSVSCVICAYDEADRIQAILDAVCGHPALAEVIVVNDGSTDGTMELLAKRTDVRVVSHHPNRGKTYALSRGIAAAQGDYLMFLDADLTGLTAADVHALVAPVLAGEADVTMSLRRNSLGIYRAIGMDFVTGERVMPAWLLRPRVAEMGSLPRWGAESWFNGLVIEAGLRVAVTAWRDVYNVRKHAKSGLLRGASEELRMIRDALSVLSVQGAVKQNLALLALTGRRRTLRPEAVPAGRNVRRRLTALRRRLIGAL